MIDTIEITQNPVTATEPFLVELQGQGNDYDITDLTKRKMGGFYSAQFSILRPSRLQALEWLHTGVGRNVRMFNEHADLGWEGMIRAVSLSTGRVQATNSLEEMWNKIFVRYQDLTTGTNARSTAYEHLGSQAAFGIKERAMNGGEIVAALADQYAQLYLKYHYWPTASLDRIDLSAALQSEIDLVVKCDGYWKTLEWQYYNQTVTDTEVSASILVSDIITACGQFVKSTSIQTNATPHTDYYDADRRPREIIESVCEMGDSDFRPWVYGFRADREFYFEPEAEAGVLPTVT